MSVEQSMVAYKIELVDGSIKSGTMAVPTADPAAACRCAVSLIRGNSAGKYGRPEPFSSFLPQDIEDISVQFIGPA